MKAQKKLGIWMDHENAHLMEFSPEGITTKVKGSKFTHQQKTESLVKSENLMHHKEQHLQAEYYKDLGNEIKNYNHVLIFGPTNAKSELLNLLKADHSFNDIIIKTEQTDKLTINQQEAFVKNYFEKPINL